MKRFLFLLYFAVGCADAPAGDPFAETGESADTAPLTAVQQAAVDAVAAELRTRVHALTGEVDLYHYVSRGQLKLPPTGVLDLSSATITGHPITRSRAFFAAPPPFNSGDAPGLYAAIDPVASRGWGGGDFLLYRIRLPKGATYVDLISPVSPAVAAKTTAASCAPDYRHIVMSLDPSCRPLGLAVVAKLGVQALRYDFLAATNFGGCKAKDRGTSAFVLLAFDKLPKDAVQVFAAEIGAAGAGAAGRAASDGRCLDITPGGLFGSKDDRPWPSLDGQASGTTDWMNQHLLFCNGINE
jgi:hypothetical protein